MLEEDTAHFRAEATERLERFRSILDTPDAPIRPSADDLDRALGTFHSIKGAAAAFGMAAAVRLSHALESALQRVAREALPWDSALKASFLRASEVLEWSLGGAAADTAVASTIETLDALAEQGTVLGADGRANLPSPPEAVWLVSVDAAPGSVAVAELEDLFDTCPALGRLAPAPPDGSGATRWILRGNESADELRCLFEMQIGASEVRIDRVQDRSDAAAAGRGRRTPGGSVRIARASLRALKAETDQLRANASMMRVAIAGGHPEGAVIDRLGAVEDGIRRLSSILRESRSMSVSAALRRLPQMVDTLAVSLGKCIDLHIVGGELELDADVLEALVEPLLHLLRNAADHGIELPDRRRESGKPVCGTVLLVFRVEAERLAVEISDDGAGLRRDALLARARAQGLVVPNAGDDAAIWQLIFAPGFSTADRITDLSGRGIGMDVVRRSLERLGAAIDVRTCAGLGTTFTISIPLAAPRPRPGAVEFGTPG